MGTNFYWYVDVPEPRTVTLPNGKKVTIGSGLDDDDPNIHIGKRSAAGAYCWDCDITLCKEGNDSVHRAGSMWHNQCPKCGKKPIESADEVALPAKVELGHADARTGRPDGVQCCSSFLWAQEPEDVLLDCARNSSQIIISDEYGSDYTGREFADMIFANCPVSLFAVGEWFS